MRLYALTLACLVLLVSLTAAAQPRRTARRVAESTPTPEEAALLRKLDAHVRALWREGEEGFFPRRTRIEQLKISDTAIEVYFSDGLGSLSSDEATQEKLEALLRPELDESYQEVPLRFFLRQMSLEALRLRNELNSVIEENWKPGFEDLFPARTSLTDLEIIAASDVLRFRFSPSLSWMPLRPALQEQLEAFFRPLVPEGLKDYAFSFYVEEAPVEDLIVQPLDPYAPSRVSPPEGPPLVRLAEPPAPLPTAGLYGRHLVVSMSHGWMYDSEKSFRWEWQRARLFNTVEDMHTISYGIPWLIPMLERAGAVVFHTRERDWQTHEVVLDDADGRRRRSVGEVRTSGRWRISDATGFQSGLAPYPDAFNPHQAGSVHEKATRSRITGKFQWIPNIPEAGEYGVYVSYHAAPDRAPDARYTVYHSGGQTTFLVNQRMGGNTWVWLGRFQFEQGTNRAGGRVELDNVSEVPGTTVCADAVKFGGGMGDVLRGEGETSGYPRYLEGARYWLQYAGAPPELTYKMGFTTGYEGPDYTDDFSCRAEWANYLRGGPFGPNKKRSHPGLGIPIDLFFSLHTDAGISEGIVGTLMIYRSLGDERDEVFPDGRSRLLNRELGDLLQTQVVEDARALYSSSWSRRQLRDANYAESRLGNVPSCLMEMMSHQNFNDMKYGLDPRFQRDCARALYKGMLRFLAREYGFDPVVQPLPPTHLSARQVGSERVELRWRPQLDPLEPTADPAGYVVYHRIGDGGFDKGVYTVGPQILVEGLRSGEVHSFCVEAVNAGGRSFPSETLAVALAEASTPRALIVYGFDRIGPPSTVIAPDYKGYDKADRGVGYQYYFGRTGFQYDFDPKSRFVSNDAPGHGATSGEMEDLLERGNTLDYVARHGQAFLQNGWAFDSASNEAVAHGNVNLGDYALVDWILGEQRTEHLPSGFVEAGTPDRMQVMFKTFTPPMQAALVDYATAGGALLVSGAYVGTDLANSADNVTADAWFLKNILHIEWVTNHGSNTNVLFPQKGDLFDGFEGLRFARGLGEDGVYGVELPDAIDPVKDSGARTVLRYGDRRFSAGVVHEATETAARTMVLGFPFETIVGGKNRAVFLRRALAFLAPEG